MPQTWLCCNKYGHMNIELKTDQCVIIKIFSSSSWWYQFLMPFYSACELILDDISANEVQQGGQGAVTEVLRCRPCYVYGTPPSSGVENGIPLTNYVTMMWPEWEANWFSAELMWQDGCSLHLVESVGTSAWQWSIGDFSILIFSWFVWIPS